MAYSISKLDVINYTPEKIREFHVYTAEWIDNLHFMRNLDEFVLGSDSFESLYVTIARERLREAGWDGDGPVQLMWLPAFAFPQSSEIGPEGVVLWHVKQTNDGLSWLLSPVELPFEAMSA